MAHSDEEKARAWRTATAMREDGRTLQEVADWLHAEGFIGSRHRASAAGLLKAWVPADEPPAPEPEPPTPIELLQAAATWLQARFVARKADARDCTAAVQVARELRAIESDGHALDTSGVTVVRLPVRELHETH
jgi:hypothetical protein